MSPCLPVETGKVARVRDERARVRLAEVEVEVEIEAAREAGREISGGSAPVDPFRQLRACCEGA